MLVSFQEVYKFAKMLQIAAPPMASVVNSSIFRESSNKNLSSEVLGGGFKYFLFSPLFGEDSHFD